MEQTQQSMPLVLKEVIVLRALSSEANILVLQELIAHQLVYIKRVNARNAQMVITVSSEDKHHKQQRFWHVIMQTVLMVKPPQIPTFVLRLCIVQPEL